MNPKDQAQELADLIGARLGVRGNGLEVKICRAGRLLPRRVRRDATMIAAAARHAEHPRLSRQADASELARAHRACKRFLQNIDGSERVVRLALGVVAANALNLLVVSAALIAVLVWRGYL